MPQSAQDALARVDRHAGRAGALEACEPVLQQLARTLEVGTEPPRGGGSVLARKLCLYFSPTSPEGDIACSPASPT